MASFDDIAVAEDEEHVFGCAITDFELFRPKFRREIFTVFRLPGRRRGLNYRGTRRRDQLVAGRRQDRTQGARNRHSGRSSSYFLNEPSSCTAPLVNPDETHGGFSFPDLSVEFPFPMYCRAVYAMDNIIAYLSKLFT
jgi:hypothetical protein